MPFIFRKFHGEGNSQSPDWLRTDGPHMKLLRRFRFHVSSNCHEGVCEPVLAFSSTCPIHAFDVCDWLKFSCLVLTFCEFMPVWHKAAKGIVLMPYIRCKVHARRKWRYHHNSRHSQCQTRWLDYTNACRGTYKGWISSYVHNRSAVPVYSSIEVIKILLYRSLARWEWSWG